MIPVRTASAMLALAAAVLCLSACGRGDDGGNVLHRGNTAEPLTLDPHRLSGNWEMYIMQDMMTGLYAYGADGEQIPGMALRHDVSEDGMIWTFHLREAQWSDGEPVTAHDFVYGLRRVLNPETIAPLATLLYAIRNAEAVHTGALPPEELGVYAADDRTFVIEMEYPAPYITALLAHPTTYPAPAHVVERHGAAWIQPQNIVVNGPYILQRWRSNDFVHLVRNDSFYEAGDACFDEVYYYPTTDVNAAVRRVRAGELHLNNSFPPQQIEELRRQLPDYVRVHPALITTYYVFNMERAPFDDVRVRRALSMAVDREFITSEILGGSAMPTSRMVPPGAPDYPDVEQAGWWTLEREERLAEARRLLEEAGFGPSNPLRFEFTYRNSGSNPRIAPVVQANWQEIAPWVQASIFGVEVQIHYENLRGGNFQVGDAGWVGSRDPWSFLNIFESGNRNDPRYASAQFDDLMRRSNHEIDPAARGEIMADAERTLVADAPVMPVWHDTSRNLVHPDLRGWVDNVLDTHPTRWLCLSDAERQAAD